MATNPIGPPPPRDRFGHAGAVDPPQSGNLATGQTPSGTGTSTHIVDRGDYRGPGLLKIVSTIGATPSVTVAIEGSTDGVDWYPVPYATQAAPETPTVATFAITTATTNRYHIRTNHAWRFLRLSYTAALNVTLTADLSV